MVTYLYRCPDRHETDLRAPMGAAPSAVDCRRCGRPTRRVFTAPTLRVHSPARTRALDAAARSAEEPAVATAADPRPAPAFADPRHALLPRA